MKVFPKEIYVRWDGDGDDSYLDAEVNTDLFDHGDRVAIYERREIQVKRVTHTFEPIRKPKK